MQGVTDQQILTSGLLNNLSLALGRERCGDTALAMIRRAVGLDPTNVERRINLACLLIGRGEDDEAEALTLAAISLAPKLGLVWQMMGRIKTHRGDLKVAIDCFKKAQALNPESGQAKFDLAAAYLRAGDYANGLAWYEHRGEVLPFASRVPPFPKWDGQPLKHVLIWGDQGFGDRIMFARFLPNVRQLAEKVTFLTDPATVPLFQGYTVLCDVVSSYHGVAAVDAQYCLASLPFLFGTTPTTIPADAGLISVSPSKGALDGAGLKIGIAWAGNRDHPNDTIRSMRFEALLPLAHDPRNDLYSLQCGAPAADIGKAQAQRLVGDMAGHIQGEWTHTAAVLKALDLVVTVDTAIAHLAGALRVPTMLLLPLFPDWRWGTVGERTPWYPTMRLFRQTRLNDWRPVVERVCAAIGQFHNNRALERVIGGSAAAKPAPAPEYEPEVSALMRRVLRPGDTFIDVGANVGRLTVLGANLVTTQSTKLEVGVEVHVMEAEGVFRGLKGIVRGREPDGSVNVLCEDGPKRNFRAGDLVAVAKSGRVIAIEPGENNLPALRAAIKDKVGVVEIIEKAAWRASDTTVEFYENLDDGGGNASWNPADWPGPHNPKTKAERPAPRAVDTITLDAVCAEMIKTPRLIKIDTEGAEEIVLQGAVDLLRSNPPFIVCELHEFGLGKLGCSQDSLRQHMTDRGYSTFMLFADGSVPMLIPHGTRIETGLIVNLLFSTPAAIAEVWPTMKIEFPTLAPMHAYGLPKATETKLGGLADQLAVALRAPDPRPPSIKLAAAG